MVNDSVREELISKVSPMAKTAKAEIEKAEIISKAEKARAEIWSRTLPPSMRNQQPAPPPPAVTAASMPKVAAAAAAAPTEPQQQLAAAIPEEPPKPSVSAPVCAPPQRTQVTATALPSAVAAAPQQQASSVPSPVTVTPKLSIATTKPHTMEFVSKPTSPTLKEFQNRNAVLPEWRLQLQNSVRKRNGGKESESTSPSAPQMIHAAPQQQHQQRQTVLVTSGATALKAEPVQETAPSPETVSNPTLAKALQRIEQSRQKYAVAEERPKPQLEIVPNHPQQPLPPKYPFIVAKPQIPQDFAAPRQTAAAAAAAQQQQTAMTTAQPPSFVSKPKTAAATVKESKAEKFDTNKLPPLSAKVVSSFEKRALEIPATEEPETEDKKINSFKIKAADAAPDVVAYAETAAVLGESAGFEEEVDDRAPISMRFNAGLFDLIIGSFLSVVLLAPFMLSSGNLFTLQGLFAFLATCSIVMFIYLTTTIGTMGRTFGMKLFSLELVDIEENAYPTFHQAAVNSSVYLVSLALGGLGFLTLFLNHEKRAAHDLLSGTIVVREYE